MEIWFAALTGLREASELGHQHTMQGDDGVTQPADITINANRLLWRSMVLVKVCGVTICRMTCQLTSCQVPFIIEQLYTRKQSQSRHYSFLKRENDDSDATEVWMDHTQQRIPIDIL